MVVYSADATLDENRPLRPPAPLSLPIPSLLVSRSRDEYTLPSAPHFHMDPVADSPVVFDDTVDTVYAIRSSDTHLVFVAHPLRLNFQLDTTNTQMNMTTYRRLFSSPHTRFSSLARLFVSPANNPATEETKML